MLEAASSPGQMQSVKEEKKKEEEGDSEILSLSLRMRRKVMPIIEENRSGQNLSD